MFQQTAPPRAAVETTRLLAGGVVAGPLFLAVALIQALVRDGFDLGRHPISLLSLGDLRWIQIAGFVVTGVLCVACAVGMRRGCGPAGAPPGRRQRAAGARLGDHGRVRGGVGGAAAGRASRRGRGRRCGSTGLPVLTR
jgi:Protein of unknown function (DUF998)